MNRTFSILPIALLAVAAVLVCQADLADAADSEFTAAGITYVLVSPDEVSVIGIDVSVSGTDVAVPDTVSDKGQIYTVVSVGPEVFMGKPGLHSVTVGSNVMLIDNFNFAQCSDLVSVTLSSSVRTVGQYCFYSCPELVEVYFGSSVDKLGAGAFTDCPKMTRAGFHEGSNPSVTFDGGALIFKSILMAYFGDVPESYIMSDAVTSVAASAFEGKTTLKHLALSANLNTVGAFAFAGCSSLEEVVFTDELLVIDRCAFRNCTSLQEAFMPDNLRMLGELSFSGCVSLNRVTLGYWLSYIGEGAFSACPSLEGFELSASNSSYICEDGILYVKQGSSSNGGTSVLLQYPQGKKLADGVLDLSGKNGLVAIKCNAFMFSDKCEAAEGALRKVILPSSIQEIEYSAFSECYSLEEVNIPGSVETLEPSTFYNCTSLKHVTLSEGLEHISGLVFVQCPALAEITFPSTLTYIGSGAFISCTALREIVLPDNKVTLGNHAFGDCTALTKVTVLNSETKLEAASLETSDYPDVHTTLTLSVPEGFTVSEGVFGQNTTGIVEVRGEPPYPYENWVAIVIIVLIMMGILRFIRRV